MNMKSAFLAGLVVLALFSTSAVADIVYPVDYQYYQTPAMTTSWTMVKDAYGFGSPLWDIDGDTLGVPNQAVPDATKIVQLEIDYSQLPENIPALTLDAAGTITFEGYTVNTNDNSVTWRWDIYPQPAYEEINFPEGWDYGQGMNIERTDVATTCVPEPLTLIALGMGIAGLGGYIRRRRMAAK